MTTNTKPKPSIRPRTLTFLVLLGAAVSWGGVLTVQAVAAGPLGPHIALASAFKGSLHGGHPRRFADLTEAEVDERIERIVKHVAIEIDATEEQSVKITELVSAVIKDMRPMRDEMQATKEQLHALLTADQIDREALETLRAERLAEIDQMSQKALNAAADVAEVLTPDQRRVLDQRLREFRSMFPGHPPRR
ncbi:MAG: Spy/CpxP family protein refolding chaperone [Pseudomonadota bacterium]